jgi:hypothetical protein
MPIYGWGWRAGTDNFMEVPAEFEMDAEQPQAKFFKGLVSAPGHPLDGMWVFLSQRHVENDGYYNLRACDNEPGSFADANEISGYAEAVPTQP